jgi:hypothetical protein
VTKSKPCAWLCYAVLAVMSTAIVEANVLSEALILFPSDTKSVEYNNLSELRKLANYQTLRRQYTDRGLRQALRSFRKLGMREDTVEEVVLASNDAESYGIAFGTFSGAIARKTLGWTSLTNVLFHNEHILCPHGPSCVWFFEDSTAVFGTQEQLRRVIEVRDGGAPRMPQNAALTDLLTRSETTAPVIGAGPGSKILSWIGESIPQSALTTLGLNKLLSSILWFCYDVSFPRASQSSTTHVEMKLLCSSESDAATLRQVLGAYSVMQQAGASTGLMQKHFDHAAISSSGTVVAVKADLVDPAQ